MQRRGTHRTAVLILRRRRNPDGAGGETISLDEVNAIPWWARIRPLSAEELTAYQTETARVTHAIYLDSGIPAMEDEVLAWGIQRTDTVRRTDTGEEFLVETVRPASDGSIEAMASRVQTGY